IYDTSIQLADKLNQISRELSEKQIIALELAKKHHKVTDAKIVQLEHSLDKLQKSQTKVLNIVKTLMPMLANHLSKKHQKKSQLLIDRIDALKTQKQTLIEEKLSTQKDISRPLIFREHKQKLIKLTEEKPKDSARKSIKKNI